MSRFSLLAVTLTLACAAANADDPVSTEVYSENTSLNTVHPHIKQYASPFGTSYSSCCQIVPHRAFALWADYCSTPRGWHGHGRCFGGSKGCETKGCETKRAPSQKSLIQKISYEAVVAQKGCAQKATQKHSCQKSVPAQKHSCQKPAPVQKGHCQKRAPVQKHHWQKPTFQKYRGVKGCEPKCFTAPKYSCQKPTFQKYHAPKGCAQKHVAQKSWQKPVCQKAKGCAQKGCAQKCHTPKFRWPHHAKCDPCGPVYKGKGAPAQKYVHQKAAKVYLQKAPCHQKAMPVHQKAAKGCGCKSHFCRHSFHGLFNKPCAAPKGGKGKGGYDVYDGGYEMMDEEIQSITPPAPERFENIGPEATEAGIEAFRLRPVGWSY